MVPSSRVVFPGLQVQAASGIYYPVISKASVSSSCPAVCQDKVWAAFPVTGFMMMTLLYYDVRS